MAKKRLFRVGLPLGLAVLIPSSILRVIRRNIPHKDKGPLKPSHGGNSKAKVEVFLHLSDAYLEVFGHMDIAIGDEVYSFGNYDESTIRLFGAFADGVLAVIDREKYIEYCTKEIGRVVFGFPIECDEEEILLLQAHIGVLCPELSGWQPPVFYWREESGEKKPEDPSSKLYAYTKAAFYKVGRRKYKTYFALGTNCVSFVDELLSLLDIQSPRFSGTLSPGEYLVFLEKQAQRPELGRVKERNTYIDEQRQRDLLEDKYQKAFKRVEKLQEKMRPRKDGDDTGQA